MLFFLSSPLAFVEAAPIAPALFLVVVDCLIWLLFGEFVIIPWLDEQFAGKRPWWKKALMWPADVIKGKVRRLMHRIKAEMSHRFLSAAPGVARWLHNHALILEQLSGVIVASNEAALETFSYLRHTTIPTLIERAVAPLRSQLTKHTTRLDALEDLNRQVSTVIGTGLRTLPWGVPGNYVGNFKAWWNSYSQLWDYTYNTVRPRLNELWNNRIVNLRSRLERLETQVTLIREEALPAIRQRLGRIEDSISDILTNPSLWVLTMLGLSLVPAMGPGALRAAIGNLTCRNTQTIARNVCQMDERLLSELLAGTLLFAIALDPREIARAGQLVTEGMAGLFSEIAIR